MSVTNLTFGNKVADTTTSYNVAGGSKLFKKKANRNDSFNYQIIWAGLDQLDGKVTAQGSNNDVDFDDLDSPNTVLLDSANGSASIQCPKCDAAHHAANLDVGTATAGTVTILLNEN